MIDFPSSPSFRQRTAVLLVLALVGHLILISAQVQSGAGVPVLESWATGVAAWAQGGLSGLVGFARNGWGNYVALRGARIESESLRSQLAEMEVRLQEQRALAERTVRLQALMELRSATSLPTLAAEIIAGNPNPGMLTVTVDRGSEDGVKADMAVIAPRGIVGRIVGEPASHAARVQLIIDSGAAAGALDQRSRAGGMIVGADGEPPLHLLLVSNLADVVPGDHIVTSGADGVYPRGFAIGTVDKAERGSGLSRYIAVRPAVDFSSLEEVLIVLVPARGAGQPPPPAERRRP